MNIVEPVIEHYIGSLREPARGVLQEMEALAQERTFPIVGPLRDGLAVCVKR